MDKIKEILLNARNGINPTREEIHLVFKEYNKLFNSDESTNCGACIAKVFQKMNKIIDKIEKDGTLNQ